MPDVVLITSMILKLIESISLIIASFTAIYGINAWQREYRGKKECDLAEEVLYLFYESRDKIRIIRNLFSLAVGVKTENVFPGKTQRDLLMDIFSKHHEVFNKLHTLRYRFMVLFSADKVKPFDDIRSIINDLFYATERLPFYWGWEKDEFKREEEHKKCQEKVHELESILFKTSEENDPLETRVEKIIKNIEEICNGVLLRKKSTFIGRIFSNAFISKIGSYLTKRPD